MSAQSTLVMSKSVSGELVRQKSMRANEDTECPAISVCSTGGV